LWRSSPSATSAGSLLSSHAFSRPSSVGWRSNWAATAVADVSREHTPRQARTPAPSAAFARSSGSPSTRLPGLLFRLTDLPLRHFRTQRKCRWQTRQASGAVPWKPEVLPESRGAAPGWQGRDERACRAHVSEEQRSPGGMPRHGSRARPPASRGRSGQPGGGSASIHWRSPPSAAAAALTLEERVRTRTRCRRAARPCRAARRC